MNILLLTSHSIAEHDDLAMFASMGYPVFSIGAYSDPRNPEDPKRPPLPEVPYYRNLLAACRKAREEYGDPGDMIDGAKARIPDEVLDWADVMVIHHYLDRWIPANWDRLKQHGVRVVWRTCGQSDPNLEGAMTYFRNDGLQIVRYSPNESVIPGYAGADAMIRFGKEPSEWGGWHGFDRVVGNITQHLYQRGDACGYPFWEAATKDLPTRPAGPGSEAIGGLGELPFDQMKEYLQRIRCYLYTGTIPAPYTLGLIEAMMTGVPIVSIGATAWPQGVPWLEGLFEAPELGVPGADSPAMAARWLDELLTDEAQAIAWSKQQREDAIDLFGMDGVKEKWRAFLG